MILCFEITRVTIVVGRGADKVFLHTTEPSPCPGLSQESLGLDFDVAAGDGYRYVTEVLQVDEESVEIVEG